VTIFNFYAEIIVLPLFLWEFFFERFLFVFTDFYFDHLLNVFLWREKNV